MSFAGTAAAASTISGMRWTALTAPLSVLTGASGTGKTHALRAVLLLAAPTGRTATGVGAATGRPA
jgi:hypothetical protein